MNRPDRATGPDLRRSLARFSGSEPEPLSAAERSARRQAARNRGGARVLGEPDDRRRATLWFWVTLGVIVALIVIRLATLSPARVAIRATAGPSLTIPGTAPTPTWPKAGQAALSVPGIGSLGSSNTTTETPTASLAKVMTAYLILKRYPLAPGQGGFRVTITPAEAQAEAADAAQDESVLVVRAGETLDERQLLEGLLIPSGDNVARLLGAYAAGSDRAFVAEMNATARSLGMDHTTYTDPSGFADSTVSTAADQLRIFTQAMTLPVFNQIVSMPSAVIPGAGTVTNYDPLIAEGYAGKTGSDSAAEGCLAFFKTEIVDGRRIRIAGVVMDQGVGSDTDVILGAAGTAASTMVDSIVRRIRVHTLLAAGARVMVARSASGQTVPAVTRRSLSVIGWGGAREHINLRALPTGRGLSAGAAVGQLTLSSSLPIPRGAGATSPVVAARALGAPGLGWRLSHLL